MSGVAQGLSWNSDQLIQALRGIWESPVLPGSLGRGLWDPWQPCPQGTAEWTRHESFLPFTAAEGSGTSGTANSSAESVGLLHLTASNHIAGAACFLLSALLEMMYGEEMAQLPPSATTQLGCCQQQTPHLMC